jgi:hypothetical protein
LNDIIVKFAEIKNPSKYAFDSVISIYCQLNDCRDLKVNFLQAIGFEQKSALLVVQDSTLTSDQRDENFLSKCKTLLVRPPAESAFYIFSEQLEVRSLDSIQLTNFATASLGYKSRFREHQGMLDSEKTATRYVFQSQLSAYWQALRNIFNDDSIAIFRPFYVYLATIMCHPLHDGNGRVARNLLKISLSQLMGVNVLPLPLAVSFYRHQLKLEASVRELLESGDWSAIIITLVACLEDSLRDLCKVSQALTA